MVCLADNGSGDEVGRGGGGREGEKTGSVCVCVGVGVGGGGLWRVDIYDLHRQMLSNTGVMPLSGLGL